MKRISLLAWFATIAISNVTLLGAEADRIQFSDKKVWVWEKGGPVEAKSQVALPFGIRVETNGTFTVAGGQPRQLHDGDILGSDGMLLKRDGSITPVQDCLTSNRGRVLAQDDGTVTQSAPEVRLGDGTTIRQDRKILLPDGTPRWLLDGELFRPSGGTLPARDTVTVQNGRVLVQKDGSMLAVGATRTIMMNDGTKVFGDGTIVRFNGDRATLSEGEVMVIEGVMVRPR